MKYFLTLVFPVGASTQGSLLLAAAPHPPQPASLRGKALSRCVSTRVGCLELLTDTSVLHLRLDELQLPAGQCACADTRRHAQKRVPHSGSALSAPGPAQGRPAPAGAVLPTQRHLQPPLLPLLREEGAGRFASRVADDSRRIFPNLAITGKRKAINI